MNAGFHKHYLDRQHSRSVNFKRTFWYPQFSQKTNKKFDFTTMIPKVDLFSFVFWEKLKTPKRHFEIK